MKSHTIKLYIFLLSLNFFFFSCEETDDGVSIETGRVITQLLNDKEGYVLAIPQSLNLDEAEVSVSSSFLNLTFQRRFGDAENLTFEVFKEFNDGSEITVGTFDSLPINIEHSTIEEFIQGTNISDPSDLRIGDTFTYRLKYKHIDSEWVYQTAAEAFNVVVSCTSDLVGTYNSNVDPVDTVEITEIGTGVYSVSAIPYLTSSGNVVPFEFSDVCNEIIIDYLIFDQFLTIGEGTVNPTNGEISFNYITYSGPDTTYDVIIDTSLLDMPVYSPN